MLNGKILYSTKGAAKEYGAIGCNFYNGCSNGCDYCYLRRGVLSTVMGGSVPTLKKGFADEDAAFAQFVKEFVRHYEEIRSAGGIFLSFSTDPCLPETIGLTMRATHHALANDIPVQILTKMAISPEMDCAANLRNLLRTEPQCRELLKMGFTLTGHDELEGNASHTGDRIKSMQRFHKAGIHTFASLEPVIDTEVSFTMIRKTIPFCDEYRTGLMSGIDKAYYNKEKVSKFVEKARELCDSKGRTLILKKSIKDFLHI